MDKIWKRLTSSDLMLGILLRNQSVPFSLPHLYPLYPSTPSLLPACGAFDECSNGYLRRQYSGLLATFIAWGVLLVAWLLYYGTKK